MRGTRAKIGEDGRIVIPAELRQILGLEIGDTVLMRVEDGQLVIETPREAVRKAQMLLRQFVPEARSLVAELIAERRCEAAREDE